MERTSAAAVAASAGPGVASSSSGGGAASAWLLKRWKCSRLSARTTADTNESATELSTVPLCHRGLGEGDVITHGDTIFE